MSSPHALKVLPMSFPTFEPNSWGIARAQVESVSSVDDGFW